MGTKISVLRKWPSSGCSEVIASLLNNYFISLFVVTDSFYKTPFTFEIGFWKVFDNSGIFQLFTISKTSWSLVSVCHVSSWFGTSQPENNFFINGWALFYSPNEKFLSKVSSWRPLIVLSKTSGGIVLEPPFFVLKKNFFVLYSKPFYLISHLKRAGFFHDHISLAFSLEMQFWNVNCCWNSFSGNLASCGGFIRIDKTFKRRW